MLLIVHHAIFVVLKISVVISVSPLKQYPTRVNTIRGDNLINIKNPISYNRPRGPTDKASDYESGDSRFESWRGRFFFKRFIARDTFFFFKSIITSSPNRLWPDSLLAAVSLSDNRSAVEQAITYSKRHVMNAWASCSCSVCSHLVRISCYD